MLKPWSLAIRPLITIFMHFMMIILVFSQEITQFTWQNLRVTLFNTWSNYNNPIQFIYNWKLFNTPVIMVTRKYKHNSVHKTCRPRAPGNIYLSWHLTYWRIWIVIPQVHWIIALLCFTISVYICISEASSFCCFLY